VLVVTTLDCCWLVLSRSANSTNGTHAPKVAVQADGGATRAGLRRGFAATGKYNKPELPTAYLVENRGRGTKA